MAEPTYTRAEVLAAFERMTERERHVEAAQDHWEFWSRNLPRPLPLGVAEELGQREAGPAPVDLNDMDMETYIKNRDRLGVKSSGDVFGTQPWSRTTQPGTT
jgi:hypothetical protein